MKANLPPSTRRAALLAALLALLTPRLGAAETDGRELLARIGVTAVEQSYSGQKMVIDFSRLMPKVTKMSILYQPGGRERRDYHSSRGIVVVDGDYFYHYRPDKKVVIKKKLPGDGGYKQLRKESLQQALVSYELRSAPSDIVAGRKTHLYEFRPRQKGSRPLRKVWVDIETGLVLRMEIYGPDSRLFLLSVFEAIEYQPKVSPASFTMSIPSGVRVVETSEGECLGREEAESVAGLPLSLPAYLPLGFAQKCIRAHRSDAHGEIQVVYSDGLTLLSLFESSRARSGDSRGAGALQVGGAPAALQRAGLVTALSWPSPHGHLTILGEIAKEELLRVAESVSPVRELSRP